MYKYLSKRVHDSDEERFWVQLVTRYIKYKNSFTYQKVALPCAGRLLLDCLFVSVHQYHPPYPYCYSLFHFQLLFHCIFLYTKYIQIISNSCSRSTFLSFSISFRTNSNHWLHLIFAFFGNKPSPLIVHSFKRIPSYISPSYCCT